jgi:hypothetical protein
VLMLTGTNRFYRINVWSRATNNDFETRDLYNVNSGS